MKLKICIIGMLLGLCISGCNQTPDISAPDFGTETGEGVTACESTEILNPPNGEIHYTEAELKIMEETLGNHENAQEIMKQLNYFGIYNIIRADLLAEDEDQELEVESFDNRIFVIHYSTNDYHIYAIKKDGEYVYAEYQ
ncbi:MAG: hypothetical protein IJP29_05845 [Lachnospiraceae bacterium]|nr:hypothetical protein [Lachnospiraceae bacterium]